MKLWKRNAVVAAIVVFVCAAVYLNWLYSQNGVGNTEASGNGKLLGEATLVATEQDSLLGGTSNGEGSEVGQGTQSTNYFSLARINRQQARDAALSLLQQAAASEEADQTMKEEANIAIQTMASFTLSEAQIENLVTAKGYADCVAFIGENSVSVVVPVTQEGITAADTAKITEIVMEETGLSASKIKIIEAD